MKKRLCVLFAAVLLCLFCATPVLATESDVPVRIAGNTYFDEKEGCFLYYVDAAATHAIRSSAADGMITTRAVSVKADAGVSIAVYRNGEPVADGTAGSHQQPGEYVVMYMGGQIAQQVFSFSIVPELTNAVSVYSLPLGFEVTDATLDGEPILFARQRVSLEQEGSYDIRYRCIKTDVPYQLMVTADYTPPVLTLEEVSQGVARGPVDISEAKQAAVVKIYLDGEKIGWRDVLTQSGEYHIELADEAGNTTSCTFTILVYFDGSSWLFFLIMLFAAVAVVVYLVHSRKHLRVR